MRFRDIMEGRHNKAVQPKNQRSMIPINELRYGSWVKAGENGLRPGKVAQVERWSIDNGEIIVQFLGKHPCGEFLQDIQPIPLTPEVLEKCGFEAIAGLFATRDSNGTRHIAISDYDETQRRVFNRSNYVGIVHLEHLHQLQNLYFSLTGAELTYNP